METSFHDGQYLLVNKLSYHFGSLERGDVIIFHYPPNPGQLYIKRIVGLPQERVEIRDGEVYINGKLLEEPICIHSTYPEGNNTPMTVPPDEYFVLGDNRNHSSDSRSWGTVPRENIVGEVWLCYWPPGEWGLSPGYEATLR